MLYRIAGFVLLALASIGVVLPLLPTTPFVLLAAACFAKSSPKLHQKLLNHRIFGPIIQKWELERCVSRKTKCIAISSMVVFGAIPMIIFVNESRVLWFGLSLMLVGMVVVLCLRECKHNCC